MARTLIAATDYIVAEGHPNLVDIKNRYIKELWASFVLGHDPITGRHIGDLARLGIVDTGTYTGNGTTQTIPLPSITDRPDLVMVWSEDYPSYYIKTLTTVNTIVSTYYLCSLSDAITALENTSFTVGADAEVNAAGTTFYYFAVSNGPTPDTGDASSAPAWIGHNVAMQGGNSATMANSVENALDTSFQMEHEEVGLHKTAAFSGISVVDSDFFFPLGISRQVVPLNIQDLEIAFIMIHEDSAFTDDVFSDHFFSPYIKTLTMQNNSIPIKVFFSVALPISEGVVELGTGEFAIDGTTDIGVQETIFDIQDGTVGTSIVTDSTIYNNFVKVAGTTSWVNSTPPAIPEGTAYLQFTGAGSVVQLGEYWSNFAPFNGAWCGTRGSDFEISFYLRGGTSASMEKFVLITDVKSSRPWFQVGHANGLTSGSSPIKLSAYNGDGIPYSITGTTDIKDNTWHTIVISYTNEVFSVSVDGSIDGTPVSVPGMAIEGDRPFLFGHQGADGNNLYMDRIKIKRTPKIFNIGSRYHYFVIGSRP